MNIKRLWHTAMLCSLRGPSARANYLRKQHIFNAMGKNCSYMPRVVPLYPNLIRFGDNVKVASNVSFFTHDGIYKLVEKNKDILPESLKNYPFKEGRGCIEIGNNVFLAANCSISYNVKIGDNVIVTAGSVVSSDIPSNSVVRGNPAKVMCTMTQYMAMRAAKATYPDELEPEVDEYIGPELEKWLWNDFRKSRKK